MLICEKCKPDMKRQRRGDIPGTINTPHSPLASRSPSFLSSTLFSPYFVPQACLSAGTVTPSFTRSDQVPVAFADVQLSLTRFFRILGMGLIMGYLEQELNIHSYENSFLLVSLVLTRSSGSSRI
jgi:hypothetical protein